jgi:hypothetical protein
MNQEKDNNTTFLSNRLIIVIAIILTFFIIKTRWVDDGGNGWKLSVDSDGRGYYAYLPAILIYQDLNFDFLERNEASVYGIGRADHLYLRDGQRGNKYFIGFALLLSPFFLVAWLVSFLAGYNLTGYNTIFFGSVAFASLFYLILGLIFTKKLLLLYKVKDKWIALIILLIVFSTNIFYYTIYEPSVTHIYSFAAISAFLFYIKKYCDEKKTTQLVSAAIALAIIILLRPVNSIVVLAIPFLAGTFNGFKVFLKNAFTNKKALTVSIASMAVLISLQLTILYFMYGNPFHWPYTGEGFNFHDPHFIDALFSYRKGFFLYTPVMLVAFLSIIPFIKRSFFSALSFIVFFISLVYLISSWWYWSYGGCFSLRPFIEYYTLFIIPLSVGLNKLNNRKTITLIIMILIVLAGVNLIQTYQYKNQIIHFDEMNKEKYWKVFLKTEPRYKIFSFPPKVEKISSDSLLFVNSIFNDYEIYDFNHSPNGYNTSVFYSGKKSIITNPQNAFSPAFSVTGDSIIAGNINYIQITLMANKTDDNCDAALIVSFEWPSGKIYRYDSYPVGFFLSEENTWDKIEYSVILPKMGNKDIMKIYVWNVSPSSLFIDDLNIEFFSIKY